MVNRNHVKSIKLTDLDDDDDKNDGNLPSIIKPATDELTENND